MSNIFNKLNINSNTNTNTNNYVYGENLNISLSPQYYISLLNKNICDEYSNEFITKIETNNNLNDDEKIYKIKMNFNDISIISSKYTTTTPNTNLYSDDTIDDIDRLLNNLDI